MMRCASAVLSIIVASLLQPLQGDTNADAVQGLRLFYSSLNSPQLLTGWNDSEGDPCRDTWTGITCDIDGENVTQIVLPGLMLNGTLTWSSPLDRLQNLRVLDLSNNQLKGLIPNNLPRTIELLNLQRNNLSRDIPWSLVQLVSLTELRLAHNNLKGNITDTFGKMSSLITLDLSDNGFTGAIPRSFRNLSQLSFLYLQRNEIDSGLDVLTNLRSLQAADIRDNAFHGEEIPAQLWAIPNFLFSADEFVNNASLPLNQFNLSLTNSPAPSPSLGASLPINQFNLSLTNSPAPSPSLGASLPINQFNLSLTNSPAPSPFLGASQLPASPPESRGSGSVAPAISPHHINVTYTINSEKQSFWYAERIAGVIVVSFLAMVAVVLIFLIVKLKDREKEYQSEDFAVEWLGPSRSNSCSRLVKWLFLTRN